MSRKFKAVLTAVAAVSGMLLAGTGLAQQPAPDSSSPAPPAAPFPYSQLANPSSSPPAAGAAAKPKTTPAASSGVPEAKPAKKPPKPAPAKPAEPAAPPSFAPAQAGARLAPGQSLPAAELEAYVDGVMAQAMAREHVAGAVVAVVQNGQVVLKKGYGVDRLSPSRPVEPDRTLFRLGDVTQAFTWVALMREIEAGHIRQDAPVNVYLPQRDQIRDQGYKRPVLVSDLMGQTTGFEGRTLGQLIERDPARIRPLDVYLSQERPRRVRESGTLPTNSDYGAALAGEALVQVTGKTMQALSEAEVFGPLGLHHTTLREPYPAAQDLPAPLSPALAQDVSQGFRWTGSGYQGRPFEYFTQAAPAAGASSTATDMARYMLAVLADGTLGNASIYSPAVARAFRTPFAPTSAGAPSTANGMLQYVLPGGFHGYGQDGATLSFHARLVTSPELGLGIFVAANTDTSGPLVTALPGEIVKRFYVKPGEGGGGSAWLSDNASALNGDFLTTARAYHGLEGFVDRFRGLTRVRVAPEGVLVTTGASAPGRWVPDETPAPDAAFVRLHSPDGSGEITAQMQGARAQRWFSPVGLSAFERIGPLYSPALLLGLAAAVVVSGLAAVAGLFLRDRRDFRQTSIQGRADAAQLSAAALWLVAVACFGTWMLSASDPARAMFDWPDVRLVVGASAALVATIMTALVLILLPVAWRGGRRLDSWTVARKMRFTTTTLIFTAFAVLLGAWGALEPWSS